jgi:monofunctional biosynthetic peptidoglycan transglycosylase
MRRTRKKARTARPLPWATGAFLLFLGGCVHAGHAWARLPDARPLALHDPSTTALIEQRRLEAEAAGRRPRRDQRWIRLEQVAPHAVGAVLASEDDRFFDHRGVDLKETMRALEEAWTKKRLGRGASTLTQQLAKNLWLSSDRSLGRKVREVVLAWRMEEALGKRRILELYLNVAEWGDGVYGIEAAARTWFGVSAAELTVAQSVVLASMLPAPRTWTPRSAPERLRARSARLLDRLERHGRLPREQARAARAELHSLFDRLRHEALAGVVEAALPQLPKQGGRGERSQDRGGQARVYDEAR